jgi:hypothetical protein
MPSSPILHQNAAVRVDAPWEPSWLSWVSATAVCLQTLGIACDKIDVAGYSGYAFNLSIAPCLDPSGPVGFDWSDLVPGTLALGRSVLLYCSGEGHTPKGRSARSTAHCQVAYEIVAQEIEAGRPCVIWGAYVPEFAAVCGVQDGCYLVKSYREARREPQPPIRFDEIDAPAPAPGIGGPTVFAFPTLRATRVPSGARASSPAPSHAAVDSRAPGPTPGRPAQAAGDRAALVRALRRVEPPAAKGKWATGLAAYDAWIAELERATGVSAIGAAYNAQVWAESRYLADQFLHRVAGRNTHAAKALAQAAGAFNEVAAALSVVAKAFPGGKDLPEEATRHYAEQRGAEAMQAALQGAWARE